MTVSLCVVRLANIPCVIIHGMLKGSTYDVGQKLDEKAHYGEWNAVLVNHQWRLLNAYWGACAVGSDGGDDWMEIDDGGQYFKGRKADIKIFLKMIPVLPLSKVKFGVKPNS